MLATETAPWQIRRSSELSIWCSYVDARYGALDGALNVDPFDFPSRLSSFRLRRRVQLGKRQEPSVLGDVAVPCIATARGAADVILEMGPDVKRIWSRH